MKLSISISALFFVSIAALAQDKESTTPTQTTDDVYTQLESQIPIESDDWYQSGIWKQDKDLVKLYMELQNTVRASIPVDPAVRQASDRLEAQHKADLIAKAKELGFQVDENGNISGGTGSPDKGVWYEGIKSIDSQFSKDYSQLWSAYNQEFAKRFEEAFVEAARNLKTHAEQMK